MSKSNKSSNIVRDITNSVYVSSNPANKFYANQMQIDAKPVEYEVKVTNVFARNMACKKRIVVNRGSAGSSKSYSTGQLLIHRFLSERKKTILIVRKSLPSLRISTLPMMYDIMESMGVRNRFDEEKVMLNYYYRDNWLHFGSIDDVEKIKSTSWSYIFMEEATEFTLRDFMTLRSRLRTPVVDGNRNQIILCFNPIDENHWIKRNIVDNDKVLDKEEIVSTYQDNPFLDQEYIDDLENLRHQDLNFWRIMALGEWGRLSHLIYNNWDDTHTRMPDDCQIIYGVDFGFNVPSVLLKLGIKDKEVWEEQLIYQKGLTNAEFIKKIKKSIPVDLRNRPIYADNADPGKIEEMKSAGLNVKPVMKSIREGIDFVKRMKIHVLAGSLEVIKEKMSYSWKTDKNGNPLDEPVEFNNHAQDAERYALFTHIRRGNRFRVRWV